MKGDLIEYGFVMTNAHGVRIGYSQESLRTLIKLHGPAKVFASFTINVLLRARDPDDTRPYGFLSEMDQRNAFPLCSVLGDRA